MGTRRREPKLSRMKYAVGVLFALLVPVLGSSVTGGLGVHHLRARIEREQLPLFDFSKEMDAHMSAEFNGSDASASSDGALSLLDYEIVFNDYVGRLRDHYVSRFVRELSDSEPQSLVDHKQFFVKECRVALQASIPKHGGCSSWSVSGVLAELEEDLDQIVREKTDSKNANAKQQQEVDPAEETRPMGFLSRLPLVSRAKTVWKKNKWLRWILSQSVLLFANYAQSEVVS